MTDPMITELPEGSLACADCGIAVAGGSELIRRTVTPSPITLGGHQREGSLTPAWREAGGRVSFTRCETCADRHARAASAAETLPPGVQARIPGKPHEAVSVAFVGLAALGRPVELPTDAAAAQSLVCHLAPAAARWELEFVPFLRGEPNTASAEPWAWVDADHRAAMRDAIAQHLAERAARGQADQQVTPPPLANAKADDLRVAGCLFCGLASQRYSALAVLRAGGREAAAGLLWTPVVCSMTALGLSGVNRVRGHLCRNCTEAVAAVGGIGRSAITRAALTAAGSRPRPEDDRFLADEPVRVAPWAAVVARAARRGQRAPKPAQAWSHVNLQEVVSHVAWR